MSAGVTIHRTCRDCGCHFEISPEEQELFRRIAASMNDTDWQLPHRCTSCRAARRQTAIAVTDDGLEELIACVDCGADFRFGSRDKQYYATRGFARPRRCKFCRGAHRQQAW